MNSIPGIIKRISSDDLFVKIDMLCNNLEFSACLIQSDDGYSRKDEGSKVNMFFKETDTIISVQNDLRISCRNRFPSIVQSITHGPVLSKICTGFFSYKITALITTDSAHSLDICTGDAVFCLIKSTSMMISSEKRNSNG